MSDNQSSDVDGKGGVDSPSDHPDESSEAGDSGPSCSRDSAGAIAAAAGATLAGITRRQALAGLGAVGLGSIGLASGVTGTEGASGTATGTHGGVGSPAVVVLGLEDLDSAPSTTAIGRGARPVHPGAFVIGDHSPTEIASRGPDEVRSQMPIYAPAFNTTSARAAKTDVEPVDPARVLAGVESLEISTWRFRDGDTRHIGPMAEEFAETFEVGRGEGSIATVDADGVALAAIQGLLDRQEAQVKALEAAIEERRERLADLDSRLDALESTDSQGETVGDGP